MSESLRAFCADKLAALDERRQRRTLEPTARLPGARVLRGSVHGGRTLVDFSSNDALGLSLHPRVVEAARAAVREHGAGAAASRLVSGNHPLFDQLEERLAAEKGTERALLVGSGFLANAGVIPALVHEGDLVVIDALAHASLMTGARLSRATVVVADHNDPVSFARALTRRHDFARCLVVTESVFSMDGDRAPLEELHELCRASDGWLLVDDAHGFLVSPELSPEDGPVARFADVVTGTLSKATGSYGGFIAGPRALTELLTSRARTLVYSTGLPPSAVAAALAALDVVDEDPALRARPRALAARFCAALGLPAPASHIVPVVVGPDRSEARALELMQGLMDDGFLAVAIRPPTVPAGTSRLRLSFSAAHTDDDVVALAAALRKRL